MGWRGPTLEDRGLKESRGLQVAGCRLQVAGCRLQGNEPRKETGGGVNYRHS